MRKLVAVATVLVAAFALTVPGAIGGPGQTPGVTAKSITIGGTFPLTGPAATYAPIPAGMKAYFAYINARRGPDGKRGVMGRQIIWKYYDDGYNTANTAQLTRRLVEQDKVFATVGQLGTEPVLASRAYMNQQKVPQALVFTGASYWGTQYKEFPWTTGWQPDYIAEGRLYGLHLKANYRGKKIAIVYQNDDYGKDYLYGFRAALGKSYADANVVAQEPVETTATSVAAQMILLYCTGDWVTLDEKGNYLFVGRKDHMIKTRGYRVELGEIEAVMVAHPAVDEAVALPIPDDAIGNTIHAVVTLADKEALDVARLKQHCAEKLPHYMVPEKVEFRDSLPRTDNGKVDRRRLQAELHGPNSQPSPCTQGARSVCARSRSVGMPMSIKVPLDGIP